MLLGERSPAGNGLGDKRGELIDGDAGEVVVLDEHGVEEPDAMAEAAAAADRVLLQAAEAGGGLAGVQEASAGVGDAIGKCACAGGDSGEAGEEVEQGSLYGEDLPRGPVDERDGLLRRKRVTVGGADAQRAVRGKAVQDRGQAADSGEHARLAGDDLGSGGRRFRDAGAGRDVTGNA